LIMMFLFWSKATAILAILSLSGMFFIAVHDYVNVKCLINCL
jgi:hypothetical protein